VRSRVAALGAAATAAAAAVYALVGRRRQLHWGARPDEADGPLPGDDALAKVDLQATRAIGIDAPPEAVWPWVAQMGQGRGGLYSYDRLENLVGCEMHSAEVIVAEWQDPRPGDDFHLHPDVALGVIEVDPPRALVVRGAIGPDGSTPGGDDAPPVPYDFTWAFVVVPDGPGRSRLVVRERYRYLVPWAAAVVEPVSAVSFVMTQRMLRGIRDRAVRGRSSGAGDIRPTGG
jgi:hypothetical protein